jgi:hypothetical protein
MILEAGGDESRMIELSFTWGRTRVEIDTLKDNEDAGWEIYPRISG